MPELVYIVMLKLDSQESGHIAKIFDSRKKADEYIEGQKLIQYTEEHYWYIDIWRVY